MKSFYLGQPHYLLVLLLLPLLWLRLRARSMTVVLWRTLVFLLLAFALADPQRVGEMEMKREDVFAYDLSRSIPEQMRGWMARQSVTPGPGDRVFVFGGAAREVENQEPWLRGELSSDTVKPERTSLEALFSALLRLPAAPRSVYLFTDGWETEGSIERLLPSLALSGMKVFPMLPGARPAAANVAVKRIVAPHQGTSGEAINVRVVVENQNSHVIQGNLTLKRDGQPLNSESVKIDPGTHVWSYRSVLPDEPMVSFQADFTAQAPASDRFPQDNQAAAWIAVRAKAKVLLLNGRSGEGRYLEEILKRRGFEVTSLVPGSTSPSPTGYHVVVFNNVEKERFSPGYLAAIERHVAEGNGFLMLGAEGSFAPGGYRQTPIESLLPVELKEPGRVEKNRAVVLVIDKSGSMREQDRLLYAKEAAKTVAGQLKDNDLLGVLGFDVEPFVIVPLTAVEKIRGSVAAQIDRLKAQGKTYLYPAVVEARRQLERQSAGRKHVIILSDGETGGSGGDYIELVSAMRQQLKITVSAVAIGGEANVPLLKRIAQYGGGFFHHTYDPATLPQIVLQQIQEKPDESPAAERDFNPALVKGSELLARFGERSFPPVKGYVDSELKRGAHLDLVLPTGEKGSPLLASWSYGKGKAIAFTTDLHGRWTREWIRWEALERFWGQVFDWLHPSAESLPPHEARINLQDDRVLFDLYLYAEGHEASLFRYSLSGKGTRGEGALNKLAPGHYRAALPISTAGEYRIGLVEERRGQRLSYPTLGYTLPFDPKTEAVRDSFNVALLEKLARSTGGEINPKGNQSPKAQESILGLPAPLRPYLIFLALALFLAEVIFRRFFLPVSV